MEQKAIDRKKLVAPGMAIGGGFAVAVVFATMPNVYLENIVGATGLSEIVSAAAPPLGDTARALIALTAGLISAAIIFLFVHRSGDSEMAMPKPQGPDFLNPQPQVAPEKPVTESTATRRSERTRIKLPKFKLPGFMKRAEGVRDFSDLPKLRPADSHPDAPPRAPLRAGHDLDGRLGQQIRQFDEATMQQTAQPVAPEAPALVQSQTEPQVAPQAAPQFPPQGTADHFWQKPKAPEAAAPIATDQPAAVQAPVEQMPPQTSAPIPAENVAPIEKVAAPAETPVPIAPSRPADNLSDLSVDQLVDRLSSGLKRLSDQPSATVPPVFEAPKEAQQNTTFATQAPAPAPETPSEPTIDPMEESLQAALGTLERLTANGRRAS